MWNDQICAQKNVSIPNGAPNLLPAAASAASIWSVAAKGRPEIRSIHS